jgi:hypothetical protein
VFEERTNKKRRLKAHHWIFEMHIEEVVKKFPERKKRERRWVSGLRRNSSIIKQFYSLHCMKH